MIKTDSDALTCDMAETYGIYEIRALPLSKVAVLAFGLRDSSRIKIKMAENKVSMEQMFLAAIVDRLSLLVWMQTKDGYENRNRPESILEKITGLDVKKKEENPDILTFDSVEDFERMRKKILEGKEGE